MLSSLWNRITGKKKKEEQTRSASAASSRLQAFSNARKNVPVEDFVPHTSAAAPIPAPIPRETYHQQMSRTHDDAPTRSSRDCDDSYSRPSEPCRSSSPSYDSSPSYSSSDSGSSGSCDSGSSSSSCD